MDQLLLVIPKAQKFIKSTLPEPEFGNWYDELQLY